MAVLFVVTNSHSESNNSCLELEHGTTNAVKCMAGNFLTHPSVEQQFEKYVDWIENLSYLCFVGGTHCRGFR